MLPPTLSTLVSVLLDTNSLTARGFLLTHLPLYWYTNVWNLSFYLKLCLIHSKTELEKVNNAQQIRFCKGVIEFWAFSLYISSHSRWNYKWIDMFKRILLLYKTECFVAFGKKTFLKVFQKHTLPRRSWWWWWTASVPRTRWSAQPCRGSCWCWLCHPKD